MTVGLPLNFGYSPPSLGALTLAIDPNFQYGVVAGTSNQPKLGYLISFNADQTVVPAGALLTLNVDGSPLFSNHAITVAEYNNDDIVNSGSAFSAGAHTIQATLSVGSSTVTSNVLAYTYNVGISVPTVSGTALVTTSTPTYTITWGATKPNAGDVLVLYVYPNDGVTVQNAQTTPNKTYTLLSGDVSGSSMTISPVALPAYGYYFISAYVYRSDGTLSPVSTTFSQTYTTVSHITTNAGVQTTFNTTGTTYTQNSLTIEANSIVVIGLVCLAGSSSQTLTSLTINVPHGGGGTTLTPIGTPPVRTDGNRGFNYAAMFTYNNNSSNTTCDLTAVWGLTCDSCAFEVWSMTGAAGTTPYAYQTATSNLSNPNIASVSVPNGGALFGFCATEYGVAANVVWDALGLYENATAISSPGGNGNSILIASANNDTPAAINRIVHMTDSGNSASLIGASFAPA